MNNNLKAVKFGVGNVSSQNLGNLECIPVTDNCNGSTLILSFYKSKKFFTMNNPKELPLALSEIVMVDGINMLIRCKTSSINSDIAIVISSKNNKNTNTVIDVFEVGLLRQGYETSSGEITCTYSPSQEINDILSGTLTDDEMQLALISDDYIGNIARYLDSDEPIPELNYLVFKNCILLLRLHDIVDDKFYHVIKSSTAQPFSVQYNRYAKFKDISKDIFVDKKSLDFDRRINGMD